MNEHLLQINISPGAYLAIVKKTRLRIEEEYWPLLPVYKIAQCPFCQTERDCLARLDTYGIFHWPALPGNMWGINHHILDWCPHLVTTEFFINLNGFSPTEVKGFINRSEVPFVNPRLLDDAIWATEWPDMDPCVVMHALPICRVERGHFVPRYSVFTFVYYARHREPMWEWFMKGFKHQFMQLAGRSDEDWWDLNRWVAQSKLGWLESSSPELAVRQHPTPFPYGNIKGHRAIQIIYRDGQISPIESRIIEPH